MITNLKRKKEYQVLVKWIGWEDPTWEAFCPFAEDSPEMVHKYLMDLDKKTDSLKSKYQKLSEEN